MTHQSRALNHGRYSEFRAAQLTAAGNYQPRYYLIALKDGKVKDVIAAPALTALSLLRDIQKGLFRSDVVREGAVYHAEVVRPKAPIAAAASSL